MIRADELGFCFGVRDALDVAFEHAQPERVAIWGELVHNAVVNERLAARGFVVHDENDRSIAATTRDEVLVTAHGVSDADRAALRAAGKRVVDTTCPLVTRAHDAARALAAEGRHVVVVGKPGHVEVRGLVGDLRSWSVFARPEDVVAIDAPRLGIVSQTTMPIDRVRAVVAAIEACHADADVVFVDTACEPTKRRVAAVAELAKRVEVVVVVGGANSNNTKMLAELAVENGARAHHVQGPGDLRGEWFTPGADVGLTAGTSTLDETIDAVEARLRELVGLRVGTAPAP